MPGAIQVDLCDIDRRMLAIVENSTADPQKKCAFGLLLRKGPTSPGLLSTLRATGSASVFVADLESTI